MTKQSFVNSLAAQQMCQNCGTAVDKYSDSFRRLCEECNDSRWNSRILADALFESKAVQTFSEPKAILMSRQELREFAKTTADEAIELYRERNE